MTYSFNSHSKIWKLENQFLTVIKIFYDTLKNN